MFLLFLFGLCGLCVPCLAASEFSTNYSACALSLCPQGSLAWSAGEFDQIYLVQESKDFKGTFLQPKKLQPEDLIPMLLTVKTKEEGSLRPLFDKDDATTFAQGLVAALGQARPSQVTVFLKTTSSGFLANPLGNSGRAFIDANGLNLIFGEVGIDFAGAYNGVGKVRFFEFGSRTKVSGASISADSGMQIRSDWIAIPIKAIAAVVPSPAPDFDAQELRLKRLKKLRDGNLITQQEYEAKKAAILKDF